MELGYEKVIAEYLRLKGRITRRMIMPFLSLKIIYVSSLKFYIHVTIHFYTAMIITGILALPFLKRDVAK